jgi:uncharacterized protein YbjT (DUF2867 family)
MNKTVLITGATGMVGKGVLLECLDHDAIKKVVSLGRNSVGIKHPKLTEIIHDDFSDFTSIKNELTGIDACFFCLGISAAGLKEAQYMRITHDYTINLAKVLYDLNREMTFNYVSGQGTDSSEKSRTMWARVKGRTENDLLNMGFKQAFMFRPGGIIPLKGIKSRTKSYQFIYDYFMWLVKLIKFLSPNSVVNTTQIGKAMINSSLKGYSKNILIPKDILELSRVK